MANSWLNRDGLGSESGGNDANTSDAGSLFEANSDASPNAAFTPDLGGTQISSVPESISETTSPVDNAGNSSGAPDITTSITPSNAGATPYAPAAEADAPSNAASSSAPSNAPVLAYTGDLGDGTGYLEAGATSGTGTGSGTGTSGTGVQTTGASAGLVIDVDWDSSVANAPVGFVTAVDLVVAFYESHFSNPITITIDVGYGEIAGQSMEAGALGESESYLTSATYSQLQSALVKNADAIGDTAAVADLPAVSPVSGQYWVPLAEASALGLPGVAASVDGYVGFSSSYSFAYNDNNGVAANQYDFFGVVAHEFSEVMGRQMNDGVGSTYEPLDLFHYSAPGVRDFSGTTAGYFSANGGTTKSRQLQHQFQRRFR